MTDTVLPSGRFSESGFRIGATIQRTFSVLSRNLPTFLGVTAVASLPDVWLTMGGNGRWWGLGWLATEVIRRICQAVVLFAAFQEMRGEPVSLMGSLRIALRRILPVIGLAIIASLVMGLGLIMLIVPGLVIASMLFVATPVCVVERLGPFASLNRSAVLTEGHRWAIFGLLVLLFVPSSVIEGVMDTVLEDIHNPVLVFAIRAAWDTIWNAFYVVLVVVTYNDLRVAKEGIDISRIAAVFD